MQLSVTGKELDVGDALCRHAEANLAASVAKYFDSAVEENIVFSRAAHLFRAETAVRIGRGNPGPGRGEAVDGYPAFAMTLERTAKPLRRHERALRDHRRRNNLPEQD
jgi:ribosome-associated translation inhibitor RaiA